MNEPAQPKRRGRPPKPAYERKGQNLTFRTRADFRERLEQAASRSGRSVTEEVEIRVERSFEIDPIIRGYNDLTSIFIDNGDMARKFISSVMSLIASVQDTKTKNGRKVGSEDWKNSPATREGIRICVSALLDHYAPEVSNLEMSELDDLAQRDVLHMRGLAKIWALMSTGREDEVLALVVRQDDATT